MNRSTVFLGAALALAAGPALALDEVSFGTNWLAQAEHGGFYQAVADGTYEKYGLKVTIRQGGPQAANRSLLIAGQIDFYMGGNMLESFDAVKNGVPTVTVSAIFQKDPQIIMAHPDQGIDAFADLAKLPTIFLGKDLFITGFQWMKQAYPGFKDEQYKPYTFNPAPFIADPQSAQQGYLTSEPFEVERQAGWKPKIFLLADQGFDTYSTTIEAQQKLVDEKPDLVQRFVDASAIGWYNYLYGDNKAANALIKTDNPEMTDEQIAFSIAKMKEYGIVESAEALTGGIGCMTDAHHKSFYDKMVAAAVVDASVDVTKAYTLKFVCKGVGLDVKKALGG
ncbi:ABC transporter substrate-binding protein [Oharaeibacter diazotrophicus]|uniref:NitT/TauT family transport system substrate-binding protein n=1 Tax=Oharaeibacter diazotrophicus TaxID=1920512 RepID=A0A4R6REI7_9HYPH|nr:ABC transporter substrate-binding protein [Oharaeibacter diazotrophicus]TDP84167.1 NitT/TauT family transport system substrate-binding protein [Oharaeibacter diazotrophicus]BBE73204.1 NMT1/THI5 like protein [Pleomorphomonas sp. SM30]GLS74994.1 ABC transporter substrate-binding protein [Oharaeibacter diazotrophicus]